MQYFAVKLRNKKHPIKIKFGSHEARKSAVLNVALHLPWKSIICRCNFHRVPTIYCSPVTGAWVQFLSEKQKSALYSSRSLWLLRVVKSPWLWVWGWVFKVYFNKNFKKLLLGWEFRFGRNKILLTICLIMSYVHLENEESSKCWPLCFISPFSSTALFSNSGHSNLSVGSYFLLNGSHGTGKP